MFYWDALYNAIRLGKPFPVTLEQSYRVIRVIEEARKNTKVPTLIEFIIDPEDLVYPMVKPGGTLEELILDC